MGKVRIKTFDETENSELEAKKKAKRVARLAESKRAKKTLRQAQGEAEKTALKTQKQSEDVVEEKEEVAESPIFTEKKAEETVSEMESAAPVDSDAKPSESKRLKKEKFVKQKTLSARVNENRKMVSKSQTYPLDKAVGLLVQFKTGKFDETVELHVNVREQGTSGTLRLPHGSGKTLRIKIADDALLSSIEKGNIDFDVLVATPDMMPRLAKVARVLGPKGLMPNPKNGTVTTNPEKAVKKLSGGEMRFKTESKAPVIHLIIGKLSFGDKKIIENAQATIDAIGSNKIKSAILTSTMSPGIRLQVN
jgi:large subunit ribosomal protein L1